ncbi:MAG: DegV family EDD domain-containing protein [Anaerolineales bacterium]|nr:DegV family EDD domain-containing protein [Anaerolineales bacterium]
MTKIAVVTDSSAFLPDDVIQQYGIRVVPLTVIWGSDAYLDNVEITTDEFYDRLRNDSVHPTTTQPNPEDFLAVYKELAGDHDGIVAVLISSELSGTVSSARTAAAEFDEIPVRVIDTRSTSMGLGLAVLEASRCAAAGGSIDEVERKAADIAAKVRVLFVVDTLEYLHRGGRIGGASRLFGTALGIKPLLHLNEGRVDALERVRTKKKAVARMLELASEYAGDKPVCASVIHASTPDEAEALKSTVSDQFDCQELYVAELSPVIATHAGPGTIGIALCPN